MYIHIYIHTDVHTYERVSHMYKYMYKCIHIHISGRLVWMRWTPLYRRECLVLTRQCLYIYKYTYVYTYICTRPWKRLTHLLIYAQIYTYMYKYIHIYIYIGQLDMADPPVPKGMLITDATVSPFISDLIDELGYERVRRCLLQCAAVCCSVLQCAAVCCSALT